MRDRGSKWWRGGPEWGWWTMLVVGFPAVVVGFLLVVVGFLFQWGGGIFFSVEGWNVEGGIFFSEIEG